MVIFDEKPEAYEELRDAIFNEVEPVGVCEQAVAETITFCILKQRRTVRTEASIFRYEAFDQQVADARNRVHKFKKAFFANLDHHGEVVMDKAGLDAALAQLEKAEAARDCETLAFAFENASKKNDMWTKLSRYEVANERSLYRAIRELERLQAARKAEEAQVTDVIPSPVTGSM